MQRETTAARSAAASPTRSPAVALMPPAYVCPGPRPCRPSCSPWAIRGSLRGPRVGRPRGRPTRARLGPSERPDTPDSGRPGSAAPPRHALRPIRYPKGRRPRSSRAWSCRPLRRREDESSVFVLQHPFDAATQGFDGLGDAPGVATRVVPDLLQEFEPDATQLRQAAPDEGLRPAQLLSLRGRGLALLYGGESRPALLVAAPYGLEAFGTRSGLRSLVAAAESTAVQLAALFGQFVGLQLAARRPRGLQALGPIDGQGHRIALHLDNPGLLQHRQHAPAHVSHPLAVEDRAELRKRQRTAGDLQGVHHAAADLAEPLYAIARRQRLAVPYLPSA